MESQKQADKGSRLSHVVVFTLEGQEYGLQIQSVERILPALAVTHVPEAPPIMLGVISLEEVLVPVIDLRRHLGLPEKEILTSDRLIIAQTSRRRLAFLVDHVAGVLEPSDQKEIAGQAELDTHCISRAIQSEEKVIFILDPDAFLSDEEGQVLDNVAA